MTINHHSHSQWGSKLGFILAAVGSAVGLGNIWKFPYMIGESGGSAFVFVYLFCVAFVGFPILISEWLIGRRGQANPIDSMKLAAEDNLRSKGWTIFGISGVLGAFLILSFYSVIGGWALNYIVQAGTNAFAGFSGDQASAAFSHMLANPRELLIWHTVFMAITMLIVALGVSTGIERASKIMMPMLGLCLFILVGYGFVKGDMSKTLEYLFSPNWSAITPSVMIKALGHAFFTLSLGMGIMMSYGSYLGKDVNLARTAGIVIFMDTFIAIAAGLAIFPIVFAHGLPTNSGPGLIFITLPIAFGSITGGAILGIVFFVLLSFAAITSAMSLMEPVVELVEEKTPMGRITVTLIAGVLIWALGIAALLSFNTWSDVHIFGLNIFDLLDQTTQKFLMPLTGLGIIIFFGWFMRQQSIKQELELSGIGWFAMQLLVKFIAPISVLVIFLSQLGLLDWFWKLFGVTVSM